MSWSFETDPVFQKKLDWADGFVREWVEPLDYLVEDPYNVRDPLRSDLFRPLQSEVRHHGLWACHLGPGLGGAGYGQLKLALLNEILGRSKCAPIIFGCQAPDSGNSEILAHYGSEEQKERFLRPLIDGDIVSAFSMTEPQGGADPKVFTTCAVADGGGWVINGEKWFTSNAKHASFLIVMAVTDPDSDPHHSMSMFIVPSDAPGINIVRNVSLGQEALGSGTHAYIRYENVRVPSTNLLGGRGAAFEVAQTRLGNGRVHYAMRAVGVIRRMFDMMRERAVSRTTQGGMLGEKQLVQDMIAQSWVELEQFRLLTLQTAWRIDKYNDIRRVRADISAVKMLAPTVMTNVAARALQLHGSLGLSSEMPFVSWMVDGYLMGLGDGPTEIHKVALSRELLKGARAAEGLFPTWHWLRQRDLARQKYDDVLKRHLPNVAGG
jgi:acyl-CoA dehydrogenase